MKKVIKNMITKETIKKILKPSIFKIIFTLIMIVLPLVERVTYNRIIVQGQEVNLGLKIIHYVSEILYIPIYIPITQIQNLGFELARNYSEPNIVLLFMLFFLIYFYSLSCLVSFSINKIENKIKKL